MRRPTLFASVLLLGFFMGREPAFSQAPAQKTTTTEPAKKEGLREKARQIPLQSLVRIKQADGRSYQGRLVEVSNQGIAFQVMLDTGVEARRIPFDQLKSIQADYEPGEWSKLGAIKGLFRVPHGSLIELHLTNGEKVKGIIEEFLDHAFVFRSRNKNLLFETTTINFGHLNYFLLKAEANLGVISDPEAFKLIAASAGGSTSEGAESRSTRLRDGTPVIVRLRHTISTADARVGDAVDFEIVEEIKDGERVVLPKSGAAWGKIAQVVPKRRMGRGARVSIEIAGARTVSGGTLALKAAKEGARGGKTSDMVGAMVGAGVFAAAIPGITAPLLLMRGTETAVPQGTLMIAYVAVDKQTP